MLQNFSHPFLKAKLKRQRPTSSVSTSNKTNWEVKEEEKQSETERTEEFMDVVDYADTYHQTGNSFKRHKSDERVQVIRIPSLETTDVFLEYQKYFPIQTDILSISNPSDQQFSYGHTVFEPLDSNSNSTDNKHYSASNQASRKQSFIVKGKEMRAFFRLLEDEVIQDFFEADKCMKISDKYLIAMVFAYFKRAEMKIREYTRVNFFVALYLGNDMEEDEEEDKYEIFPWALGQKWQDKFPRFLRKRDLLWSRINYMALVSKRCCEEIMAIDNSHPVWKRCRQIHHAGAIRSYMKAPEDDGYPRGPHASPRYCHECDNDSQYDSASPGSASWYISSGNNSPQAEQIFDEPKKSRFDMNRLKTDLPKEDDDAWPSLEE